MIKLTKSAKPKILEDNAAAWTANLIAKLASGELLKDSEKTQYRHTQVKQALIAETYGKCAYCESKIKHIHHGDVEHIHPKSLKPELMFDWENLTFACEICNQNKSNKDPLLESIIDPYKINPSDHLIFIGSIIFSLGSALGKNTEILLDLNRIALCEVRKEKLEKVMLIIDRILDKNLAVATRKAIYIDLIKNEGIFSSEYSAMISSAIQMIQPKIPDEIR